MASEFPGSRMSEICTDSLALGVRVTWGPMPGSLASTDRARGAPTHGAGPITAHRERHMNRSTLIGGAAAALLAIACSDSSSAPKKQSEWSGAVIKVAASNPDAKGELRGIVVDSTSGLDPSDATPIAGATVVLNLKVTMQGGTGGSDTSWTTVEKQGEVVTDADGKFLVTNIPEGDYFLQASPPANAPFYNNSTWAFVSSGNNQADAVIYLPRKLDSLPGDSLPGPTGPPIEPPDSI
jgi:hypothetical protein